MNAFQKALANLTASKSLETVLAGSSFLGEGTYDFTVTSIDTSTLVNDGKMAITYTEEGGKQFTDRAFFFSQKGGLGYGTKLLITGTITDVDAHEKLFEALGKDPSSIEMLTGLKLQGTLKRGPGYQVHSVGTGGYAAYEGAADSKQISEVFADVKELRSFMKASGEKASYINLEGVRATHAEENLKAFNEAYTARNSAPKARVAKIAF